MSLAKRYDPKTVEPRLQNSWQQSGIYHFSQESQQPIYSIDTPPPTVSGNLHLGHVYSYSHTDFMSRFWRMNGYNVFYPMGYDDNGLPTERLVEKKLGATAQQIGRQAFIEKCLEVSVDAEHAYKELWERLGLSIDWNYSYRTIDDLSRRTSQTSFINLYKKDLAYRQEAPTIWCPECQTAIAQAELNDLERESEFITIPFQLSDGTPLPIATTRPELLPACVAVFVHPEDPRYKHLVDQPISVPLIEREVPLLPDTKVDPEKGTGAVMCCTFGDTTDVEWWYKYKLPLRVIIDRSGHLTQEAGQFAGLTVKEARRQIVASLDARGLLLKRQTIVQSVRVHERDDTPVEYIVTRQWFIRVLDFKEEFLKLGEQLTWHPAHMKTRYREWVENLGWDWCISRQRYYGVTFPIWYCNTCNKVIVADASQLPVDPTLEQPVQPCDCGSTSFTPEQDVMDTWATSSLSPQIVGHWLTDTELYKTVFPMALRPQAHEIIRTWAFYTIVQSYHHFKALPWKALAISGWGLAPGGTGKISKSRGGGPMAPKEMIEKYSADAVRYWAASTGFGKDATISEEKITTGTKLVTKLWNVARFCQRFLDGYTPLKEYAYFTPTDRWILSRTQQLIRRVTTLFQNYDYAAAKSEIESFFWRELADNYLEMAKERLYNTEDAQHQGACYTLYHVLLTILKLFAPFLPYVTDEIYQTLYMQKEGAVSLHITPWPIASEQLIDAKVDEVGENLIEIATFVRRYKSEHSLSLGTELQKLQLFTQEPHLMETLWEAVADIKSVTRVRQVEIVEHPDPDGQALRLNNNISVTLTH